MEAATRESRVRELAEACREVLRRQEGLPIEAVFLYGSALTDSFRPDSDVDIAVLDEVDHRLSWADQSRLMDALERATGRGLDLRMLRDSSPSHQAHVLEQGRLLWPEASRAAVDEYRREVLSAMSARREGVAREWAALLGRLARAGTPTVPLPPVSLVLRRKIGQDDGLFEVPEDFDSPLSDETLMLFQG